MSKRRVTIVWSDVIISAVAAMGSLARCGSRAVPALAAYDDRQVVRGRHHRSRPADELAVRRTVEENTCMPVRRVGAPPGRVEDALLDHHAGTVPALLAGLEHQHDVAAQAGRGAARAAGRRRSARRCAGRGRTRASRRWSRRSRARSPRRRAARPCPRAAAPSSGPPRHAPRPGARRSPRWCRCPSRSPARARRAREAPSPACAAGRARSPGRGAAPCAARPGRRPCSGRRRAGPSVLLARSGQVVGRVRQLHLARRRTPRSDH